jgi:hypothetical protein
MRAARAARTWAGRFALGVAVFVLAGCASVVRVAYNNGDIAVRMMADEYLDLRGEQAALFKTRLARLHAWHRSEELPRYAYALESAAVRLRGGAGRADVVWAIGVIRERYRALAGQAVDEAVPVLATLTPANIAALEKKLAASNSKFVEEFIAGDAKTRESARIERISERFEEWLGSLSSAQRRIIGEYVRAQEPNQALRLADRKARQRALIGLLSEERDPAALRTGLRGVFVEYEEQRGVEYARTWREWEARVTTLIADVLQAAPQAQREYAAERLLRYAADFRALAAEGRPPPGTRTAEEAAAPGA